MPDSSISIRDAFALSEQGGPEESSETWNAFRARVSKEVKGIKTAAMPDLAAKVGELLEIPIPGIFLTSWKKANVLNNLLVESQVTPESVFNLELDEHTINSQHHPHIEIAIKNLPVKRIEFTLRLVFNLKGFVLKIQNGAIKEMLSGICEARGSLEYQGLMIVERKSGPINLPASIPLEAVRTLYQNIDLKQEGTTARSGNEEDQLKAVLDELRGAEPIDRPKGAVVIDRLRVAEALDRSLSEEVPSSLEVENVTRQAALEEVSEREQIEQRVL